jgi:hypothetical protein
MQQHSSSTCKLSRYLSVDPLFQSLWFLSKFPWWRVASMTWLTVTEYLCHEWSRIWSTYRFFPHSWLTTGFVTRETREVSLVEQELLTLPENATSPPVFSGVRVTRYLIFCVVFYRSLFALCRLATVLSLLRLTPFGTFELFFLVF